MAGESRMDERVFRYKPGRPIPAWDLRHRLPVDRYVGPECQDSGTIFRINSSFMDVTDQPFAKRQHLGLFVILLAASATALWALVGSLIATMTGPLNVDSFAWRHGMRKRFSAFTLLVRATTAPMTYAA
jgi:hypothetical protein